MLLAKPADLDLVLVPTGILFMVIYHLHLVYKIIRHPNSTVIGFENGNKRIWVRKMMQDIPRNTSVALAVISNNISAATYLLSLSVTLSSLIGTIVGTTATASETKRFASQIIYGDKSTVTASIKYAALLFCFLIAFISHVQCIRYYIHVSFLISTPDSALSPHYVENAVIRGSNFWSLGLRSYYFAFPLLLWIFGPIPMFTCAMGLVIFLYFLDLKDNPIPPFGLEEPQSRGKDTDIKDGMIGSSSGHHTLGNLFLADVGLQQLQLQTMN